MFRGLLYHWLSLFGIFFIISKSLFFFFLFFLNFLVFYRFGGGPACNHLFECDICRIAAETLSKRQRGELEAFTVYNDEFQFQENTITLYAISMEWFRKWQLFVRGVVSEEPGPINNTGIAKPSDTIPIRSVRPGSDYAQINTNLWRFFYGIYGGGPEILLRGSAVVEEKIPTKVEEEILENMEISETDYSVKKSDPIEIKTKIVKNVSFEDGDNPIESTSQQEPNLKKSKQNPSISEISMKKEKKYRAMKNSGLFGVEGNFKSYNNIPDETQLPDDSKPKLENSVVIENGKEIVPLLHQTVITDKNDETIERKSHNGRNSNRKKIKNKSGRKQANSFSQNNESDNN